MHDPVFSIRELVSVITCNYRLVHYDFIDFVICLGQQYFMIHFKPIKYLSHMLIKVYFMFSIVSISLHFGDSLIWWQLKIIGSRWEIDVSYVGPEKFFSATLCGAFSLVFWLCVFDHSLWLFSSHGFHILCRLSSISFFSFSF